jgi:hypothetical protein
MNTTAPLPKCCCCRARFQPDPRNRYHQKFCSRPRCQRASKRASQRHWLNKAENRGYFCGPDNVRRVQEWRKENPEYTRKPCFVPDGSLQENWASKIALKKQAKTNSPELPLNPLQEVCRQHLPLLLGLIGRIEHFPLQEDIAVRIRQMIVEGQCILDRISRNQLHEPSSGHRQTELSF